MPVPNEAADTLYNWMINQTAQTLGANPQAFGLPGGTPGPDQSLQDYNSLYTPGGQDTNPSSPTFPVTGVTPPGSPDPFGAGTGAKAYTGPASYGDWNPNWDKYGTAASNAAGFGPWGGPNADGPPAWLAQEALKAYNAGDQARMKHLLDSATGPDGPKGTLGHHIVNFLTELFAGSQDRIKEAMYYQTNPSIAGVPNFGGTPGDWK